MIDLDLLREQLEFDEGCKYEIYNDHLGLATFGIGHLVREGDPEHGKPLGTPISEERVIEAFESDIKETIKGCVDTFDDFYLLPHEVQLIIANMMFNLGYPRFNKFVKMLKAIDARDWEEAANQMVDSKWYRQVPNRAKRLEHRMREVANA